MLAYCWPIVYDHGSAVKQHWLNISFLQGTPATQYPITILVQCWKSVIDDGTTFNQHCVSASLKEAVTSAERKYILDLQVNKYGLLAVLWQEETGCQLKSSKCLVYQGADFELILQQSSIVEYQAGGGGKRLADLVDQLTLECCHSFRFCGSCRKRIPIRDSSMPKRILSQCGVSSDVFISLIVPTTCSSICWD